MNSKRNIFAGLAVAFAATIVISGCDRVENPFPAAVSTDLDQSLYPGNWNDYVANEWPTFGANTNTERNVLIEDYTGHKCVFCPAQTTNMKNLEATDPEHILTVAIHAGPLGLSELQEEGSAPYEHVFYNDEALYYGNYFGQLPGSNFTGNPMFTVSRVKYQSQYTITGQNLPTPTGDVRASALKINIQSAVNYYPSTRGVFLHTEVDKLDAALTDLAMVVYLVEDSVVAAQSFPGGVTQNSYVHHDILRGCIDGQVFGRTITDDYLDADNGNYYLNYSYRLPDEYDPTNMHLLIYVMDKNTLEIYQVIEQHIED
jgi:hypothetical protein